MPQRLKGGGYARTPETLAADHLWSMARRIVGADTKRAASSVSAALARAARKELAVRDALPKAFAAYEATLFDWQRRLVHSAARRKVMWCGRRSGKTHVMGAAALKACIDAPGATVPIFERTTTCQAASVLWKFLQAANERFNLGASFHHSLLRATLPNRSEIIIIGADTVEAADKARGAAYPAAFVDEAGTFRPHILEYLLTDVLDAALLDHQGQLTMAGTPPPRWTDKSPFWAAAHNPAWEHFHTTFLENDALPLKFGDTTPEARRAARESEFAEMLARNGWTDKTPRVMREWLGLWVQDTESLLYRLSAGNHEGVTAPDMSVGTWYYGLGVDFGYEDPTAFVVVAWKRGDSRVWVLESYEAGKLIPSAVAAHIERLRSRYNFRFIIGDTGGAGKPYAEELKQRYAIPIGAARKRGKAAYLELLNGDLASNQLLIVPRTNEDLIEDLYTVRRDHETGLDDAADHAATHLPDALRYTITEVHAQAGLGDASGEAPPVGSTAWHAARERALEAEIVAAHVAADGGRDVPGSIRLDDAVRQLGGL